MSGDNGKQDIGTGNTEIKSQPNLELHIIYTPEGKLTVNGCIKNEPIALFMLEKSKDVVKAYNAKRVMEEQQGKIQPVKHGIFDFAKRRF